MTAAVGVTDGGQLRLGVHDPRHRAVVGRLAVPKHVRCRDASSRCPRRRYAVGGAIVNDG